MTGLHTDDRRIDPDHYAPTLSTGWRDVARACHTVPGLGTPDGRPGEVIA